MCAGVSIVILCVTSALVGRRLQRSLQVSLSVHSCVSSTVPQDRSFLSLSLLTWSGHRLRSLALGLFPVIFISSKLVGILYSSIQSISLDLVQVLFNIS
jgi:hypothetical protein